jgi:uncharacterized sulfatase
MAPLQESLSALEAQVLSDIYDAEVAYQDHLLGTVFDTLTATGLDQNTLVIVVADHGEGLGEHQFVGHAFVVFEELVRVPLIIRHPQHFPAGERIRTPVSTRRLFHTVLEAAGVVEGMAQAKSTRVKLARRAQQEIRRLSLTRTLSGFDPEQETVLTEAFPPHILIRAMEKRSDALLDHCQCHTTRRALYQGEKKLVQVGQQDSLYDLATDPAELQDQMATAAADHAPVLQQLLQKLVNTAEARRPARTTAPRGISLEGDADLIRRMQELGYLD